MQRVKARTITLPTSAANQGKKQSLNCHVEIYIVIAFKVWMRIYMYVYLIT